MSVVIQAAEVVAAAAGLWFVGGFRVVRQFEQGVVFRFGRVLETVRQPGLTRIQPGVDRMRKVSLQIVTMPIPACALKAPSPSACRGFRNSVIGAVRESPANWCR